LSLSAIFEQGWGPRFGLVTQSEHLGISAWGSDMETTLSPEEAEYRRLCDQLPEAQMHAGDIMQTHDIGSPELHEAGSAIGAIIRRMQELMGDASSDRAI
jgi:hypothetical protein